jgi:diguanylate cyclase
MGSSKSDKGDSASPETSVHPAAQAFVETLEAISQTLSDMQDNDADEMQQQCQQMIERIGKSDQGKELFDWSDASRLAVGLIRRERDFAVTRFDDFRQMIWVVIQGLRDAFRDEQSSENEVVQHLTRLNTAVDSESIDELRSEVVAAIALINRAIDDRKKRQHAQLEELGTQLNRMRHELLQAQKELALDPMTRLYNRASFDELLEKTIELSLFSGQSSVLLMIDVDHFKQINDNHGHVAGDQVVLHIANCLKKTVPRKTDFVARYGGDEFAVILQDTEPHDGEMLANRLLKDIKGQSVTMADGASIPLSLSIGVSTLQKNDAAQDWVNRSDHALYQAKSAGRGCVKLRKADE